VLTPRTRGVLVRKDIFLNDTCLKVFFPTNFTHQLF
jgi:hypothetical protein